MFKNIQEEDRYKGQEQKFPLGREGSKGGREDLDFSYEEAPGEGQPWEWGARPRVGSGGHYRTTKVP